MTAIQSCIHHLIVSVSLSLYIYIILHNCVYIFIYMYTHTLLNNILYIAKSNGMDEHGMGQKL